MVYDKICSVFEAKNTGIKYVFQELLFFESYYFKEKFNVIETKRTFSIGQILFFLCIFEKIVQFDWPSKIARLKLVLFNNKIDNNNKSPVTESIENVKLKVQSFILAYTTTYRILSILLHPFLMPIDYEGYLNIILILLYRYKSAYLGNKSSKSTLKGYFLDLENINFYKNIMFTMPSNLKNINIDNYIGINQKNFQFKECQDYSDDRFALFSIVNFFHNQTVNYLKYITYIANKVNLYELFQVVTYYYLFFHKLIEIEAIKINSELNHFNITFYKFFIDLESDNYDLHEEINVNLKKLFEMTLNLQKFYDYFSK